MHTLFDSIQHSLLNIFFIYFCFSFYFKYMERTTNKLTKETIIALTCGISIILCMTFPIVSLTGYAVDFRQIPFIVGALYGGRRVAVFLVLILLSYRFHLGIPGLEDISIIYICLTLSLWYLIPAFNKSDNLRKKLYIASLASFFGMISRIAVVFVFIPENPNLYQLKFFVGSLIVQLISVILFVILNEKTRRDALLAKEITKLEKLNTVSIIAASISHEVRNPLTVTKGFLQLLDDSSLSDQDRKYYINTAIEALTKAESTITDYLTFAKPSLENVKLLDLCKELTSVKNLVEPYATMNNVAIDMDLQGRSYIAGEKEKLHQCLINIVKNGIEAMPQGGKLKIRLDRFENNAMITIADTGMGMTKEQLERLGNPFFTTKDIGTGLGTMVVYSVVKSMRGTIHVDSQPDNGTRFSIILPAVEHSSLPVEEAEKSSHPSFL